MLAPRRAFTVRLKDQPPLLLGSRTLLMGVLNVTPDSFSDGGVAYSPADAVARALQMEADGADIIDIGAESTRPGADAVNAVEEWRRLEPVLKGLAGQLRAPISIDTYKSETAQRALDAGVAIVNDISGLAYDPPLAAAVAAHGAALVLMHTRGRSRDMYGAARYDDVAGEIRGELSESIEQALRAGVARDRIIVDPGLGFAKRAEHSFSALASLDRFASLGYPLLVGPSRKSFLTAATGAQPAAERDWATAAAVAAAVLGGAHIVRVHHVRAMADVVHVADTIRSASTSGK